MASDPPSEDKETRRHQNQNMMGGMKLIRQELYGDNAIKAMKDLLAAQNQSQNAISQYLKAGGSLEEIIDVLDRSDDRKDFKVAAVVFDVAHHVILTCHSSFSHRLPKVESTCHRLIRTKAMYITNMLEGPQHPKYKKAALQLLTAMVILNPRLGREILATIDLNKHRTDQLAIPCKEDYENSVRISYIRFVLACFIDDDMILIKLVLQQRHMLFAISSGLVYDDVPTVELVLTTLLEKVVKNRQLTKSVKLYALNTVFLRSLLRLYQWLGPAHIVPTFWKKKRQKPSLATSAVDKEGKEIVREMVHTFLVAFLTDKQAGISHDPAVGTSPKRAKRLGFLSINEFD